MHEGQLILDAKVESVVLWFVLTPFFLSLSRGEGGHGCLAIVKRLCPCCTSSNA